MLDLSQLLLAGGAGHGATSVMLPKDASNGEQTSVVTPHPLSRL